MEHIAHDSANERTRKRCKAFKRQYHIHVNNSIRLFCYSLSLPNHINTHSDREREREREASGSLLTNELFAVINIDLVLPHSATVCRCRTKTQNPSRIIGFICCIMSHICLFRSSLLHVAACARTALFIPPHSLALYLLLFFLNART